MMARTTCCRPAINAGAVFIDLDLTGDTFVITGLDNNDGFRIEGFTVAIPTPGTLPLMIGGAALLGFVARRKKAARAA